MKTLLLSACAAAMIATTAAPASAGQFTMNDNGPSGPIIAAGDSRYYDDDGPSDNDWRYPSQGYDDEGNDYGYGNQRYGNGYGGNSYGGNGYGNGYGNSYGYGNYGVVPPYAIVRYLDRSGFSYITQPALSGRFYQVKARDPNGRKVKLWIDAYNGHIVKVKKK